MTCFGLNVALTRAIFDLLRKTWPEYPQKGIPKGWLVENVELVNKDWIVQEYNGGELVRLCTG